MKRSAPFPEQIIDERTRQVYDLDMSECRCPWCGFPLSDQAFINRIPAIGSWFSNATATCAECRRTFHVRLVHEQ